MADEYILKSYIQHNTSSFAYTSLQLSCTHTPFVCDALCMLFLFLFLQILARHLAQNVLAIHTNVHGFMTLCRPNMNVVNADTWPIKHVANTYHTMEGIQQSPVLLATTEAILGLKRMPQVHNSMYEV